MANGDVINQLQQQQGLFTEALKAMMEGRWTGEQSVMAYLNALNPSYTEESLTLDVPVTSSEFVGPKV